jgi:hypothetical protein
VICLDYLKANQLRLGDESIVMSEIAVAENIELIRSGNMWKLRPAMPVFFDGLHFWVAGYPERHEASARLEAKWCEFWCDIRAGTKSDASHFYRGNIK